MKITLPLIALVSACAALENCAEYKKSHLRGELSPNRLDRADVDMKPSHLGRENESKATSHSKSASPTSNF